MDKVQLLIFVAIFAFALGEPINIKSHTLQRPLVLKEHNFQRPLVVSGRDIVQGLVVDNPYHEAGEWGPVAVCANDSFVTGIDVKYLEPAFAHTDETAINGVRLFCNALDGHNMGYVDSTVGGAGEYLGEKICSDGYITGMRVNTLEYQGTLTDDVAVEDLEVSCNYLDEVLDTVPDISKGSKPFGFGVGTWSTPTECLEGSAVCGLQIRFDKETVGDAAAVCELTLACCDFPLKK